RCPRRALDAPLRAPGRRPHRGHPSPGSGRGKLRAQSESRHLKPMEPIDRVRVRAREGDSETEREDALAVEEPLEIRIRSGAAGPLSSFVTTMRTPGQDEELAAGLLFAEGVLEGR